MFEEDSIISEWWLLLDPCVLAALSICKGWNDLEENGNDCNALLSLCLQWQWQWLMADGSGCPPVHLTADVFHTLWHQPRPCVSAGKCEVHMPLKPSSTEVQTNFHQHWTCLKTPWISWNDLVALGVPPLHQGSVYNCREQFSSANPGAVHENHFLNIWCRKPTW